MSRDAKSGVLLMVGSVTGTVVMAFHPAGGEILRSADPHGAMRVGVVVHAFAIGSVPILFLGFLGLSARLGWADLAVAALVAYGTAGLAVIAAAVMSGFVTTELMGRMVEAPAEVSDAYHATLTLAGIVNQAFAKVFVVASSVAILLWSGAILAQHALARAVGWAGLVIGLAVLGAQLSGHLTLDVHGFGVVTIAQSGWIIWVAILLVNAPPRSV